jgi:hypothetical protein
MSSFAMHFSEVLSSPAAIGEDLVKHELEAFGRAKRMNIEFGGDAPKA